MYPNFIEDRKSLGYEVLNHTSCGIKLVQITDSTVLLIRNLPSNVNHKTKRVILVIALVSGVWFSNLESVEAIGLTVSPTPVVRVQPSFEHPLKKIKIEKLVPRKPDRMSYKSFYKSKGEILLLIYATDPRLTSNQQVLELVKELRGGSWGVLGTAAFLGLIILIFSMGEGFVANNPNPGWGLDRPNPFQPPTSEHRYPPYYDLFFPRRTCPADRLGSSQIMAGVNPQSSREELTQLSTNVVPTQTQMSGFVKNGRVDLHQAFNEVNRRASEIGCENFECSFERFEGLATECGNVTVGTAREVITILEGEMRGYYKNARRVDYGNNIKGPDYVVDGTGEFDNITHVEIKGPVGSAIDMAQGKDGNLWQQGKELSKKALWQKKFWSNKTRTDQIPGIRLDAYLPQPPNNVLTVADLYDVPNVEKSTMNDAINAFSKNDTNLIFLNNNTNT